VTHLPLRDRFIGALAHAISSRAGWVALGTLIFVGFFAAFLPQLTPRNDPYDFVVDRDPATAFYYEFKKIFEKEDFFVVAYRQEDLFTERRLTELKELTETLLNTEGVADVVSLANVADMRGTEETFDADDFLREIPSAPADLNALRQRALNNPLYQRTLLSDDGKTTALVVFTPYVSPDESHDGIDVTTRKLLDAVNTQLEPYRQKGVHFAVAGWPVTNYYLGKYMKEDAALFFPVSLFLTLGTIWFIFRNVRLLLMAGAGIVLTLMATLGLAGLAKIPINNASIAVVPLVMALALSDIVHVFTHLDRRFLNESGGHSRGAMGLLLRSILFPCLLTSINTAIGFFSYTFNSVSAIRSFGWLAASGMFFEFIVTFGFVVPMLTFIKPHHIFRDPDTHEKREIPQLLRWVHRGVTLRPWWPLILCSIGMVWAGFSARNIQINTNLEEMFSPKSPLRQDMNFVRKNLAGMEPYDISFHSTREAFKEPALLAELEKIEAEIKAHPRINSVIGFGDYLKEMNKAFHGEDPAEYRLPKTRRLLEQYLLLYGRDDLEDYMTPTFDTTRLMVRAHTPGSIESRALYNDLRAILDRHAIAGVRSNITGGVALGVRTMKVMVDDQLKNIGSTVIAIWLVMVLVLRSWGMALLFLLPNVFPILLNFGIMGQFGIPLDTGTSLIAASAFGIIVDDTVHFFVAFGERLRKGMSASQSLEETTYEKGEASLSSTFILGSAFGVLTVSHFQPIQLFGMLNLLILMMGVAGDQLFLKSVLSLWSRWADRKRPVP
jgi:predicted RND superfamily exporter protein